MSDKSFMMELPEWDAEGEKENSEAIDLDLDESNNVAMTSFFTALLGGKSSKASSQSVTKKLYSPQSSQCGFKEKLLSPGSNQSTLREKSLSPWPRQSTLREESFSPRPRQSILRKKFSPRPRQSTLREKSLSPPPRQSTLREESFSPRPRQSILRKKFCPWPRQSTLREKSLSPPPRQSILREESFSPPPRQSILRENSFSPRPLQCELGEICSPQHNQMPLRESIGSSTSASTISESINFVLITLLQDVLKKIKSFCSERVMDLTHLSKCKRHILGLSGRYKKESTYQTLCSKCSWPYDMGVAFTDDTVQNSMLLSIASRKHIPIVNVDTFSKRMIVQGLTDFFYKADMRKLMTSLNPLIMPASSQPQPASEVPSQTENEVDDDEDFGLADTFADYKPMKLTFGFPHPDSVVETASLSSVEPPDITYSLSIPEAVVNDRMLSSLQLEAVVYCCQRFENFLLDGSRAGFLIGDGAGVGKGRTIAGVIYENFLKGQKKAVWVSESRDLKFDAERDLRDIGASHIQVRNVTKMKNAKISGFDCGVLYSTYAALRGSRKDQILNWCGPDFEGCLIFDECHRAKNLYVSKGTNRKPTKTGYAVFELQQRLPQARVLYSSATGASEPNDMAYMVRLGIWGPQTPFPKFEDFERIIDKRGVGAMEIVALDMKLRGSYLARQLGFQGVTFRIDEVKLSDDYKKMYNNSVKLWNKAKVSFENAWNSVVSLDRRRSPMIQFWNCHQRFFKYLCIAAKVQHATELCRKSVSEGKCAVIGLLGTGEFAATRYLIKCNKDIENIISTAKSCLEYLIKDHFPVGPPTEDEDGEPGKLPTNGRIGSLMNLGLDSKKRKALLAVRESLLKEVHLLGSEMPPNTLDEIVHKLGGPSQVAEMTGRHKRLVLKENGLFSYVTRSEGETEMININEKNRFMNGEKLVGIISEAASSGISLQSDVRVANQKRRVHITLELPWSADKAIQQFGRTHRSNQVNAPEYILLMSELGGERRFASIIAKRLESLGALTHGDRRVSEIRDLSCFNVDSKYGRMALNKVLNALTGIGPPLVPLPETYKGGNNFLRDVQEALKEVKILTKDTWRKGSSYSVVLEMKNVKHFLNRILGIKVDLQNELFKYFTDTLDAIILEEKRLGKYDKGILDLGIDGQSCSLFSTRSWDAEHSTGRAKLLLHTVLVERGISWDEAIAKDKSSSLDNKDGFYLQHRAMCGNKKYVALALLDTSETNRLLIKHLQRYLIFRPNIGQASSLRYHELADKYKKVIPQQAEAHWRAIYNHTERRCLHSYWGGSCSSRASKCEMGMRLRTISVLCGSVLGVWSSVEMVLASSSLQVIRLKTEDERKLVGIYIPTLLVDRLCSVLDDKFTTESMDELAEAASTSSRLGLVLNQSAAVTAKKWKSTNSQGGIPYGKKRKCENAQQGVANKKMKGEDFEQCVLNKKMKGEDFQQGVSDKKLKGEEFEQCVLDKKMKGEDFDQCILDKKMKGEDFEPGDPDKKMKVEDFEQGVPYKKMKVEDFEQGVPDKKMKVEDFEQGVRDKKIKVENFQEVGFCISGGKHNTDKSIVEQENYPEIAENAIFIKRERLSHAPAYEEDDKIPCSRTRPFLIDLTQTKSDSWQPFSGAEPRRSDEDEANNGIMSEQYGVVAFEDELSSSAEDVSSIQECSKDYELFNLDKKSSMSQINLANDERDSEIAESESDGKLALSSMKNKSLPEVSVPESSHGTHQGDLPHSKSLSSPTCNENTLSNCRKKLIDNLIFNSGGKFVNEAESSAGGNGEEAEHLVGKYSLRQRIKKDMTNSLRVKRSRKRTVLRTAHVDEQDIVLLIYVYCGVREILGGLSSDRTDREVLGGLSSDYTDIPSVKNLIKKLKGDVDQIKKFYQNRKS